MAAAVRKQTGLRMNFSRPPTSFTFFAVGLGLALTMAMACGDSSDSDDNSTTNNSAIDNASANHTTPNHTAPDHGENGVPEEEEGEVSCSENYTCFFDCWEEFDTCEAACGEEDETCLDACDDAFDACSLPCHDVTDRASEFAADLYECQFAQCDEHEEREALMNCHETECAVELQACMADQ
jgi:hypothetical protein